MRAPSSHGSINTKTFQHSLLFVVVSYFQQKSTTSFVLLVTSRPVFIESTSRRPRRHAAHQRMQSAFFHEALLRAVLKSFSGDSTVCTSHLLRPLRSTTSDSQREREVGIGRILVQRSWQLRNRDCTSHTKLTRVISSLLRTPPLTSPMCCCS